MSYSQNRMRLCDVGGIFGVLCWVGLDEAISNGNEEQIALELARCMWFWECAETT